LYEWLVIKAKEQGLAGATVLRGLMGFGANSRIHTSKILRKHRQEEGKNQKRILENSE